MTNLEKILDRFDEKFFNIHDEFDANVKLNRQIKSFITQEFTSAFKELVDLMEGEKESETFTGDEVADIIVKGNILVNRGISKCITILESWMKS